MRSLVLVLLLILCFPRTMVAAGSDGEDLFADLVTAANACLRDDMAQLSPDAYLIDYWECLSTAGLINEISTWYGDSYPMTLPPDLVAAATLTRAADEFTQAMLRSDHSLWRTDVLTILDLSDARLAAFAAAVPEGQRQADDSDVIVAATLSATTECLDAMASYIQESELGPGAEWFFGRCFPITDLVGAQLGDHARLTSLPKN